MTLTELLVALLLGLMLTAGMIKVFAGNRVTYAFTESLSRIQENARFSLNHMAYTARMAGYTGCLSEVAVHNNLDPPEPFRDDLPNGLQGFDADGTGAGDTFVAAAENPAPSANPADWTPALPAELAGRVLPGSDVLLVRSVSGAATPLVTPFSSSSELIVSTPHDFEAGDVLVATDCQKASIFQLTGLGTATLGVALDHADDSGFTPGNDATNWAAEQSYGLGSEVAALQTHAFYVGRGADDRPALFQYRLRRENATTADFDAEELVGDVETLQVRYGVDNDDDGDIDAFLSADAVGDWSAILSVEMTLLGRASDEYGQEVDSTVYDLGGTDFNPVDDRRLRQVFSTTVGIRNRLP